MNDDDIERTLDEGAHVLGVLTLAVVSALLGVMAWHALAVDMQGGAALFTLIAGCCCGAAYREFLAIRRRRTA